eukprot:7257765-Ditylum_brightwellii.AAC.1
MSEGMLQTDEGLPVYGLKVCSVPIEDKAYTREFLRAKGKKSRERWSALSRSSIPPNSQNPNSQ